MRIGIIGGTGYFGDYLVAALLRRGHALRLLARPGSETRNRAADSCEIVTGSFVDDEALSALYSGCDCAIYCIGIMHVSKRRGVTFQRMHVDGVSRTLRAAQSAGVTRFLLMSANGVRAGGTAYQATKHRADELALASDLAVTVFRPSVMFGDPCGKSEFATQLDADIVRSWLPAPSFFNLGGKNKGTIRMSPVHVADVADAFAASLDRSTTVGRTIALGGPEPLAWDEMIARIAQARGRRKRQVPVPIELMLPAAWALGWLPFFPVTVPQLRMLSEGNVAKPDAIEGLIGRPPRAFTASELTYLD